MPLLVRRIIHGTSDGSFIDMPIVLVQSFGIRERDTLVGKLTAHFDEHLNCIAKPDIPFSLKVSGTYWDERLRMTAHPVTRQLGLVVKDGIEFVIEKVVRLKKGEEVEYPVFPDRTVEDLSFEPKT
jgi:hypothetical protein